MVLTAYSALSPATGLSCHRRQRDAKHHRRLDASVGASGPHGFAVRNNIIRPRDHYSRLTLPRPPHPAPNVHDDRDTSLFGCGTGRACRDDLPDGEREIFFQKGLAFAEGARQASR